MSILPDRKPAPQGIDAAEMRRGLGVLLTPRGQVSLRGLNEPQTTLHHAFGPDDYEGIARVADQWHRDGYTPYFVLNPLPAGSLRKQGQAASGGMIKDRHWLLLDLDPERAEGHTSDSATCEERGRTEELLSRIVATTADAGWPSPVVVDSGNGRYCLFRIDLPNTKTVADLIQAVYAGLTELCKTPGAEIDPAVFDAPRLIKLPGVMARKGPGTPDRPHRPCRLLSVPDSLEAVTEAQLRMFALEPEEPRKVNRDWKPSTQPSVGDADLSPCDDFDLRGDFAAMLDSDGWTLCRKRSDGVSYWTRPGKKNGVSGSLGHRRCQRTGAPLLHVFTSNAGDLAGGGNFGAARYYAVTRCGGDMSKAAGELRQLRFGGRARVANPLPRFGGRGQTGSSLGGSEQSAEPSPGQEKTPHSPQTEPQREWAASPSEPVAKRKLSLLTLSAVKAKPVKWKIPDRLPSGKLTLVASDGGLGKTTLMLNITASVTNGMPALGLDYPVSAPGDVLLIACEDGLADTTVPRLLAMGANLDRVHSVEGSRGADGKLQQFSLADVEELSQTLTANPSIQLVVIDPVAAYVGHAGVDEHKDAELRSLLGPLADLADRTGVAIILIKHFSKAVGVKATEKVLGSVGYVNTCRLCYAIVPHPSGDGCVLSPIKSNITAKRTGIHYRLESLDAAGQDRVLSNCQHLSPEDRQELAGQLFAPVFLGEVEITADEAIRALAGGGKKKTKVKECAEWLTTFLGGYAWPDKEVLEAAMAAGFTLDNFKDAKTLLRPDGLRSSTYGRFQGKWWVGFGDLRELPIRTENRQSVESAESSGARGGAPETVNGTPQTAPPADQQPWLLPPIDPFE